MAEQISLEDHIAAASGEELAYWFETKALPEWAKISALFHTKIASALSRRGCSGVQFLKKQLDSGDPYKRHLALGALSRKDIADEEIVKHLTQAFAEEHTEWKQFALHCLARIECYPLKRVEVEALLDHSDEWLGAEATVYLSQTYPDEAIQILGAGLRSSNSIRRGYACTEAGFRNIRELLPDVGALSGDSDDFVTRSRQGGIEAFEYAQMFGTSMRE